MHKIVYIDPDTDFEWFLEFDDEEPNLVRIMGPNQTPGVLIPARAVEILMDAYKLHVYSDIFEHRPVPGWVPDAG